MCYLLLACVTAKATKMKRERLLRDFKRNDETRACVMNFLQDHYFHHPKLGVSVN